MLTPFTDTGPPDSPEIDQQNFESFFDEEHLNEPLNEDDADQVGESLMNVQHDVRLLFTRALRQYQGQSWISNEVWNAYCKLDEAFSILQRVYDHDGFKSPPDAP